MLSEKKLPELQAIASELNISKDDVRNYGKLIAKASWIAAIEAVEVQAQEPEVTVETEATVEEPAPVKTGITVRNWVVKTQTGDHRITSLNHDSQKVAREFVHRHPEYKGLVVAANIAPLTITTGSVATAVKDETIQDHEATVMIDDEQARQELKERLHQQGYDNALAGIPSQMDNISYNAGYGRGLRDRVAKSAIEATKRNDTTPDIELDATEVKLEKVTNPEPPFNPVYRAYVGDVVEGEYLGRVSANYLGEWQNDKQGDDNVYGSPESAAEACRSNNESVKLNHYPDAIASLQRQLLAQDQKIRRLAQAVEQLTIEIDHQIAFDAELRNDTQRKAKRNQAMHSDGYLALSQELHAAQDEKQQILIELELTRNKFTVIKLQMRDAIAIKELSAV